MPEPSSLIYETKDLPRRRSRKIRRSMHPIVGIKSSSPSNKRRKGCFIVLLTLRSGARSTTQQSMIWRSVELFWITRKY
jgi:hypothetical protein